jgi:hypothetical protein
MIFPLIIASVSWIVFSLVPDSEQVQALQKFKKKSKQIVIMEFFIETY